MTTQTISAKLTEKFNKEGENFNFELDFYIDNSDFFSEQEKEFLEDNYSFFENFLYELEQENLEVIKENYKTIVKTTFDNIKTYQTIFEDVLDFEQIDQSISNPEIETDFGFFDELTDEQIELIKNPSFFKDLNEGYAKNRKAEIIEEVEELEANQNFEIGKDWADESGELNEVKKEYLRQSKSVKVKDLVKFFMRSGELVKADIIPYLKSSIKKNGWVGQPLIFIESNNKIDLIEKFGKEMYKRDLELEIDEIDFQALKFVNGSHRYQALKELFEAGEISGDFEVPIFDFRNLKSFINQNLQGLNYDLSSLEAISSNQILSDLSGIDV